MRKKDIQHLLYYADDMEFQKQKYKIISLYRWESMLKDFNQYVENTSLQNANKVKGKGGK